MTSPVLNDNKPWKHFKRRQLAEMLRCHEAMPGYVQSISLGVCGFLPCGFWG